MIRVLDPAVVNQIAAGEVIERPFSVVKELVENSLDAGAQRVRVEIEEGGHTLIRIIDDGCGLGEDDLRLAFVSHATSKLSTVHDLDHIASLGFRGEALASIGSVSRARIRSRAATAAAGAEIECTGGTIGAVKPCGVPQGAQIEIRDLFYNTPARRRFLRSPAAERARIQDVLVRLALARLDVDFSLEADGRRLLHLPADEPLRERAKRAFGARLSGELIEVARASGAIRVEGLIGDPDAARRDGTLELLYVNGRCARDRAAGQAIRQAYREFLMGGRFPVYVLMLSLPPDEVDVNVHPTKAEVRFQNSRHVAGALHEAVRSGLAHRAGAGADAAGLSVGEGKPAARSGFPDLPADLFGRATAPTAAPSDAGTAPMASSSSRPSTADPAEAAPPPSTGAAPSNPFQDLAGRQFLQVMDLYLVFEAPAGLVVVDQHALHERVVYEELLARHAEAAPQIQRLLVPEVLELTATDKDYLLQARDALAEEGLLIEDFGGHAIAVQGVPAILAKARPGALVESFVCSDDGARPTARDAIHERFHSMACRSSVMSGDALTSAEIAELILAASRLEHPHNCPHGRPTVLTFSRSELERFFRRRL
ncbi:MAG: DNA mismatch repair endonuclease MutL [Planctomycetota bacterium]